MLNKQQLENRIQALEKEYDILWDKKYKDYNAFTKAVEPTVNKLSRLKGLYSLIADFELGDIPDYGDHMALEMFRVCCESGGFMNNDGHGYYATKDKMTRLSIRPSRITKHNFVRQDFTHVVWFNK